MCMGKVNLYRMYNSEVDKVGLSFRRCDEHILEQVVPVGCRLDTLKQDVIGRCEKEGK